MKHAVRLAAALAVLIPGSLVAQVSHFVIKGTVFQCDGHPAPRADVHLFSTRDTVNVQCAASGQFEFQIPYSGYFELTVTAVNSQAFRLPLLVDPIDSGRSVSLSVTLAPYSYSLAPRGVSQRIFVLGDWNRSGVSPADTMVAVPRDGRLAYSYSTIATSDSVQYELGGIAGRRSVNGTRSDYYSYDGGGDYRSVIRARPGEVVEIIFDPSTIDSFLSVRLPDLPLLVSQGRSTVARELNLYGNINNLYANALRPNGVNGLVRADFTLLQAVLDTLIHVTRLAVSQHDSIVAQYAAALVPLYYHPRLQVTTADADLVFDVLPASSPLWSLGASYIPELLGLADSGLNRKYAEALTLNPYHTVQAQSYAKLMEWARRSGDSIRWKALYDLLKRTYGNDRDVAYAISSNNPYPAIAVGQRIPHFTVQTLEGNTIGDSLMLGKTYLLDFWAPWCEPCINEFPHLRESYLKHRGRHFEMLSIAVDGDPESIRSYITKANLPWKHALVPGRFESEFAKKFEVTALPRTILVSPTGNVVAVDDQLRGSTLGTTLEGALKQ